MENFYKMPDTCQIAEMSLIIEKYIGQKNNGVFVEIGGNDGETYGCTAGLADMGWKGYYVEPVLELANKCVMRHLNNDVRVDRCAIGDHNGYTAIHVSDKNAAYSTELIENVERYPTLFTGEVQRVNLFTMDYYLSQIDLDEHIDLLVIDTEGTEISVLKGFTEVLEQCPTLIVIEHNSRRATLEGIDIYLSAYEPVYIDPINEVLRYDPKHLPHQSSVTIMEEMTWNIQRHVDDLKIKG